MCLPTSKAFRALNHENIIPVTYTIHIFVTVNPIYCASHVTYIFVESRMHRLHRVQHLVSYKLRHLFTNPKGRKLFKIRKFQTFFFKTFFFFFDLAATDFCFDSNLRRSCISVYFPTTILLANLLFLILPLVCFFIRPVVLFIIPSSAYPFAAFLIWPSGIYLRPFLIFPSVLPSILPPQQTRQNILPRCLCLRYAFLRH